MEEIVQIESFDAILEYVSKSIYNNIVSSKIDISGDYGDIGSLNGSRSTSSSNINDSYSGNKDRREIISATSEPVSSDVYLTITANYSPPASYLTIKSNLSNFLKNYAGFSNIDFLRKPNKSELLAFIIGVMFFISKTLIRKNYSMTNNSYLIYKNISEQSAKDFSKNRIKFTTNFANDTFILKDSLESLYNNIKTIIKVPDTESSTSLSVSVSSSSCSSSSCSSSSCSSSAFIIYMF